MLTKATPIWSFNVQCETYNHPYHFLLFPSFIAFQALYVIAKLQFSSLLSWWAKLRPCQDNGLTSWSLFFQRVNPSAKTHIKAWQPSTHYCRKHYRQAHEYQTNLILPAGPNPSQVKFSPTQHFRIAVCISCVISPHNCENMKHKLKQAVASNGREIWTLTLEL